MSSSPPSKSLSQRAANGAYWSALASASQQIITFLIFAVLAHKLTPLEFGVVAIASLFLDLLTLVGRIGLTEAIVQRNVLSKDIEATAFWLSCLFGLACSITLFFIAYPISDYFRNPDLVVLTQWFAPVVFLNALGTLPEGLLKRAFTFKALAIRGVVATAIGGVVAITMAISDFGAISLVAQRLVMATILTTAIWHAVKCWPSMRFSTKEARHLLHMGAALATSSLLAVGNQRILDGVIGRLLGATPLGFMRIAWRGFDAITAAIFMPILQMSLPLFSRLQNEKLRLADAYIQLSGLASILVFPTFIGSILIAPEFIRMAFGPQWDTSIVLMQILSLSALTMPLIWFKSSALLALGHSGLVLKLNVLEFLISFGIVAISCNWGLIGVAWGNVIRVIVVSAPILWALKHYVGISPFRLLKSNLPALISVALMFSAGYAVRTFMPLPDEPILKLIATIAFCIPVYFASLIIFFRSTVVHFATHAPSPINKIICTFTRPK